MSKKRIFWKDEDVEKAIRTLIECTGQKYFPTHSEIINFYGNNALNVQITRRGGTRTWAKRLNMPIKTCASELGNDFELRAIEDIKLYTGYESHQTKPRYHYDLYTNNLIKVDVKVSMPMLDRKFDAWTFNLEKREPTCDIFIFYCVNCEGKIVKVVIIPACVLDGQTQVGIGTLSKYDNYIDKWEIFHEYNGFLTEMKKKIEFIPKRRTTA